ncbi:MAG: DNA-3-methyladenine glycosylase 2 family protein [Sphingobacteriaceae bacterium]|nr:DNA-3-methyladenine glycosylase 2 family protein [Sphingobacteriaceae bacterium]
MHHLRKDPKLKPVIAKHGPVKLKKNKDIYFMLLRAIAGQQLSVKAAATIWQKFLNLFPDQYPHAHSILHLKSSQMRTCGLSFQKISYMVNIAQFSLQETLDYEILKSKKNDELIEYLIQIKGVGKWTIEMILMFGLGRTDVFPLNDLGIQNGMRKLYRIKSTDKKVLLNKMEKIASSWKPYRTIACMYIWKYKDS